MFVLAAVPEDVFRITSSLVAPWVVTYITLDTVGMLQSEWSSSAASYDCLQAPNNNFSVDFLPSGYESMDWASDAVWATISIVLYAFAEAVHSFLRFAMNPSGVR